MSQEESLVYLIRHGATAANEDGRLQGRGINLPLSKTGRTQAETAARALGAVELAAVYATPLVRARETAAIVAAPHGLPVEIVDELVEVDVGRWEGLYWEQIRERDAAAYERFMQAEGRCGYPDGESYGDVYLRVQPVLDELAARHGGEKIAVVAHSVVNRVYLAGLLGMSPAAGRELSQANGAINVIRRRRGKLRVVTMNAERPPV
ncbi:MAG: alpha-ribazole phosphatase [Planctomycetaceae bacterium]|nr:alpha-ribazole phosphatase [Planctomycetaceae bacterium]